MNIKNIAILMSCYNRRQKTLASLEALFKQEIPSNVSMVVYLTDDGSTDGTVEAVMGKYPQVKLLQGDGNLFWNGGMRLAFSEALKIHYDYYLWLNDDTFLYPHTLNKLLATHQYLSEDRYSGSIIIGSTQDPNSGKITYGGLVRASQWVLPFRYKRVQPSEEVPKQCEVMDGNCVLIPYEVAKRVGNLDIAFTHAMGDHDYGLRACKFGYTLWVAPSFAGTCSENSIVGTWKDPNLSFFQKLEKVKCHKGQPFQEFAVYAKRHGGVFWFVWWLIPYRYLFNNLSFFKKTRICP